MAHFEKRRSNRREVGLGAKIIPADRSRTSASCVVVDLSRSGAKLAVKNPLSIPDEFTLVLPNVSTGHKSRIAWRSRSEVGVRFVQDAETDAPLLKAFGKRRSSTDAAV